LLPLLLPLLPSSMLPLLSPLLSPPPPTFAAPDVGLMLRYCAPSAFVIVCHHATNDALVAGHFHRQSLSTSTAAATTINVVKLIVVHCQRKKHQQQQHQHTNKCLLHRWIRLDERNPKMQ
jgi:hypothetical protein